MPDLLFCPCGGVVSLQERGEEETADGVLYRWRRYVCLSCGHGFEVNIPALRGGLRRQEAGHVRGRLYQGRRSLLTREQEGRCRRLVEPCGMEGE